MLKLVVLNLSSLKNKKFDMPILIGASAILGSTIFGILTDLFISGCGP